MEFGAVEKKKVKTAEVTLAWIMLVRSQVCSGYYQEDGAHLVNSRRIV